MTGGKISGNTAIGYGGGVYVTQTTTFTMEGTATISDNNAANGGGVFVYGNNNAIFTMSGSATISGNNATSDGGGVYVSSTFSTGIFTKTGGTIYGDTDTTHAANSAENTAATGNGHAVYVNGNPAKHRNADAGLAVNLNSATVENWNLIDYYVSSSPYTTVAAALAAIKTVYTSAWTGYGTPTATPARIIISGTITETAGADGMVDISDTGLYTTYPPIILQGKGPGADAGTLDATSLTNKRVLYIRDADVTLGGNLTLTGGGGADGGGVVVYSGSFTMTGGAVSSNTVSGSGGGVYINSGSFTMTGGTIGNNTASGSNGGGVYMVGGSFTMTGGTISGNNAGLSGGGVFVNDGTVTMSGTADISGNTASSGGGVYMGGGTFTMNEGTVSGNQATDIGGGGGVYVFDGSFTMTGGAVSGNQATNATGDGGGVYVRDSPAVFSKTGGTIYGSDMSAALNNTAATGTGHAVYVDNANASLTKKRNTTAGPTDDLDSSAAGGWE
jgi:hypothetical protein